MSGSFKHSLVALALLAIPAAVEAQTPTPFAGVTLKDLLDTPNRKTVSLVSVTGHALMPHCTSAKTATLGGLDVVEPQTGFRFKVTFTAPQGPAKLVVSARAPTTSTDSFWLIVDGTQLSAPIWISKNAAPASHTVNLSLTRSGSHTVELTLRERPGLVLRGVSVSRLSPTSSVAPLRTALAKVHPRIFFTGADVAGLAKRAVDPRVSKLFKQIGVLTKTPPTYKAGQRNGGAYFSLHHYAMGQLLKPDPKQLAGVINWLTAAVSYGSVGVDLDARYFLEGLALTYDWLYHQIPPTLRTQLRQAIETHTRRVYEASMNHKAGGGQHFQQNHMWAANLSLALGAAVLVGDVPEANEWLIWAWDRLERVALSFSPDGSFHEGPAYWDYSMPMLYTYISAYEWLTGRTLPAGTGGLRGQAQFRFHHLYPGLTRTTALEDTKKTQGKPPVMLFLWEARRFRDAVTQGMAELLAGGSRSSHPYQLLWLDETVTATPPLTKLPLWRAYDDVGTAFVRSSWKSDASFWAMVSRPLGGKKWAGLCQTFGLGGTGHNHPAQNHFVLYGGGEVLVGDPGYTYNKETRNHNTVLVDGKGQYGDGEMWPGPKPGRARLTGAVGDGDVTIVSGDAGSAYPTSSGLTRFVRRMVQAGPQLWVVHDQLAASKPVVFSWLLHHWGKVTASSGRRIIDRNGVLLTVEPIYPVGGTLSQSTYRPQYIHPTRDLTPPEPDVHLIELKSPTALSTRFLLALQLGSAGKVPTAVTNRSTANYDAVQAGQTLVAFNPGGTMVSFATPWGATVRGSCEVLVARQSSGTKKVVGAPAGCVVPPPADRPMVKPDLGSLDAKAVDRAVIISDFPVSDRPWVVPDRRVLDGTLPDQRWPDQRWPDQRWPDQALSDGVAPKLDRAVSRPDRAVVRADGAPTARLPARNRGCCRVAGGMAGVEGSLTPLLILGLLLLRTRRRGK